MEEMLADTFESLEDDDLEDLADQEVEKVLYEVTAGKQIDVLVCLSQTDYLQYYASDAFVQVY